MRILIVFATAAEASVMDRILLPGRQVEQSITGGPEIAMLVTGIGSVSTAWSLQKWISGNSTPDLAINAGIAGSFKKEFGIGDVVMPVSDCFADLGIESETGFQTLGESGLSSNDEFPFTGGRILSQNIYTERIASIITPVKAVTVNTASGTSDTIRKLESKFSPDIETMEGAAFFYICARENITFLALRAISNMVEPRGRSKWEIPLALGNLAGKLNEVLRIL